jgi:hypothetical protein
VSCNNKLQKKRIEYKSDGYYAEGLCSKDSVFEGEVKRYNIYDGGYLGYETYKNGILDGPYINVDKSGSVVDSIPFKNGLENGLAIKRDDQGRILYKVNYDNGRQFGAQYDYNEVGQIKEYRFSDFSKKNIYKVEYRKNDTLTYGDFPAYHLDTVEIDDSVKKLRLFFYMISRPDFKMHFKIATVEGGKIASATDVVTERCFFDTTLNLLPSGSNYAIVASIFNQAKGRDDLKVYVLPR